MDDKNVMYIKILRPYYEGFLCAELSFLHHIATMCLCLFGSDEDLLDECANRICSP